MQLTILHLFPELLNLYGDIGNIKVLEKRCRLRNIETEIISCKINDQIPLQNVDIIYLGGGSHKDLACVSEKLLSIKNELTAYRDSGGVILAVSTSYPLLGHSFPLAGKQAEGLSLCDMTTMESNEKHIGKIAVDTPFGIVTGFENHSGKTVLGKMASSLGTVLHGYGNNGEDKQEGVLYKNIYGTYLHGPLLPKNPELADLLIAKAIERKYGTFPNLEPLPNTIENLAKGYILNYDNRTHKR